MDNFFSDLFSQLNTYYSGIIVFLPKLLMAIIVLFIIMAIAQKAKTLVHYQLAERTDDPTLAKFLGTVTKAIINLSGLLFALNIMGFGGVAAGILSTAGVSAFIIGFAFKDIGENFLAGILMAFDRPFRIGDTVELAGKTGIVIALNLRNTHVKSFDGKDIYIPNAMIVKNVVTNNTIDGFLRFDFEVRLDHDANIEHATNIIKDTLLAIPGVLTEQKLPMTLLGETTDSTLIVKSYFWMDLTNKDFSPVIVKVNAANQVKTALKQAGFYLPRQVIEMRAYQGENTDIVQK